jgi:biopolymer transport protein ExbB
VLAYNWLVRRNKSIMEDLAAFTNDLHGYLMSNGQVKPVMAGVAKTDTRGTAPTRGPDTPTQRGNEPLRSDTRSGTAASPTTVGDDRP